MDMARLALFDVSLLCDDSASMCASLPRAYSLETFADRLRARSLCRERLAHRRPPARPFESRARGWLV